MPVIKLNLSFESGVVDVLRQRATEENKPASRYLADLVVQDARRCQDQLAEEGYRLLSAEGLPFIESVLPLATEVWPEWNETEASLTSFPHQNPQSAEAAL